MTVHHLTYATRQFRRSADQLTESAKRYGIATEVIEPASSTLAPLRQRFPDIMRAKRGAGYWLWKPYLIAGKLASAAEGDIVIYTDAGVDLISSPEPLIELTGEKEIVLFHAVNSPLAHWTKRDAFVLSDSDDPQYWNAPILTAAFQFYRVGAKARAFVGEWLELCQDQRVLTDDPNVCGLPNLEGFIDHRHDQSVLSIVTKRHRIETFIDPSQFGQRPSGYPYGQIFDHHRRRTQPLIPALRARLQLGTRLRRLVGR